MVAKTSVPRDGSLLEDLSLDLTTIAAMLAHLAEAEAMRRVFTLSGTRATVTQVRAAIAARQTRSAAFGFDLAHPGWSVLLELFRARLEERPVKLSRLDSHAGLAGTTTLRWCNRFRAAGLVEFRRDPRRASGILIALTEAGEAAMHAYFSRKTAE